MPFLGQCLSVSETFTEPSIVFINYAAVPLRHSHLERNVIRTFMVPIAYVSSEGLIVCENNDLATFIQDRRQNISCECLEMVFIHRLNGIIED